MGLFPIPCAFLAVHTLKHTHKQPSTDVEHSSPGRRGLRVGTCLQSVEKAHWEAGF